VVKSIFAEKKRMIQRVQTVYMLLAAFLTGLILNLKLADIFTGDQLYTFFSSGIFRETQSVQNGLPLQIFILLILVIHFFAVFSYKNRIRQMRIMVFTIVLLFGLIGMILYFAYGSFENMNVSFKIPVIFPLVSVILDILAIRAIGRDEALIRSVDRIRSSKK
jgi:hypothetical protein